MSPGSIVDFAQARGQRCIDDVADVVIVGTGAGGATAARVLSAAGLEVVLLEEGPHIPLDELRTDMYTALKRTWRDMGFQVARGRSFMPLFQGSCVGGSTAVNGAVIHRIPERIHRLWQDEHQAGELFSWPRMTKVYDQLDRELYVDRAPEAVLGMNSKLMRKAAEALGLRGNEIRRDVRDCQGSAHCAQGCPTGRRQSMNVSFVPQAIANGARLYASCRAERVLARGGRAAGVRARFRDRATGSSGPELRVRARKAVLVAASALQTPVLLLASGLGKKSGLVGRRLQMHPAISVVGVFDEPVQMWFGATQGYESSHFLEQDMKLETITMPLEVAAARLPGVGSELVRDLTRFGQLAIWGVETRAEALGRVRRGLFGGSSIHYDPTDGDVLKLKLGIQRLTQLMFAAGAREVLPGVHGLPDRIHSPAEIERLFELPNDPRLLHFIAAHLFGTAKLGPNAAHSVVDPELESHELPGLYVVDSSVFPTNIGVNPQHTISAVSWLASERLAERLSH